MQRIWSTKRKLEPIATILLDAKKSFDAIEWDYLYYMLGKFCFGDEYNNTILCSAHLYSSDQWFTVFFALPYCCIGEGRRYDAHY